MSTREHVRWPLLAGGMLVQGWVLYRLLAPLGFVQDDYLNFAQAREGDTAWQLINRLVFARYTPSHRLAHLIVTGLQRGEPPSWDLARGVLAALAALGTALVAVSAFLLTRRLAAAAFVWLAAGASSATFFCMSWWAAALHTGVHWVALLLGWICVLAFLDRGRRAWLAAAFVLWAVALGAYEKAMVSTALCLAVAFWRAQGLPSRRPALLALAVSVAVLDVAYLVHLSNQGGGAVAPVSWRLLPEATFRAMTGPFSRAVSGADRVGAVAVAGLMGASVALSANRRRTLRVWGFFAVAAGGLFLPPAIKRLGEIGAAAGQEPRHVFEWWPLWLLSFSVALTELPHRARSALLGAAGALWLLSLPWQAADIARRLDWSEPREARAWAERVRGSLRDLEARAPVALFEGEVPALMVEPWYYPYSRAHVVLPLLVPDPFRAVDLDADREAYELTDAGTFQRAVWSPASSGPASALGAPAGSCDVEVTGDMVCLSARSTARCRTDWPVPPPPPGAALFALRSQGPTDACIEVFPRDDPKLGVDGWPRCRRRGAAAWTWFHARAGLEANDIGVSLAPSTRLCLERWAWGRADSR